MTAAEKCINDKLGLLFMASALSHRHTFFCFSQHTTLQLIKEALGQNGVTPRDESPVTEVLNQVCPSSWRGACKTAVQLLFAQAGLVSTLFQKFCIKARL